VGPFRSLRKKIILVFIGYSLLLGAMVVFGVIIATQISEARSQEKRIRLEGEYYLRAYLSTFRAPASNSFIVPKPMSPFINYYYGNDLLPEWAKNDVADMDDGTYFHTNENQKYLVLVRSLPDGEKFYLLYNITRVEASRESLESLQITILLVLLPIMLFGLFLGLVTAHKVLGPVLRLGRIIREKDPKERLPEGFEEQFHSDEIGFLAHTLKTSLDELHASVEREKSFARDASHELRTPVTTIKNGLELLRNTPESEKVKRERIIGRIERSTAKMEHLIKSFLWLSRHDNLDKFGSEEVYTYEIVEDVIRDNEFLLENKPIEVEIKENYKQVVFIEPQLMSILVSNILRNAFTYTFAGKITVVINENCIRVIDTGSGIKSENLKMIRANDDNYHAKGFGFGIAIVRRLCASLGWVFLIDSAIEEGTTVSICYNRAKSCSCLAGRAEA
jgi:signal transduction histidine kinase